MYTLVVTITVRDDMEGSLYIANVTMAVIGGSPVDGIVFTNRYVPAPTSAQIPGSKELIGKVLNRGAFRFDLYEADENWNVIRWLECKENNDDGSFAFSAIDYETPGVRHYLVKEVNGGEVIEGVTYDDTVYYITVKVTDSGVGSLVYSMDVTTNEGEPAEQVLFENRCVEPPPKTGDLTLQPWLIFMAVSCGAIVTVSKKKFSSE